MRERLPSQQEARRRFAESIMRGLTLSGRSKRGFGGAHRPRRARCTSNDATTKHARLAFGCLVEHASLSRGNAVFAADQLDLKTVGAALQPSGLGRARRADLDVDFMMIADRCVDRSIAEPVDIAQANAAGPQGFAWADDNAARGGIETHDVERRTRGDAQSAPLTNSEMNDAVMVPEDAAVQIDDIAGCGRAGPQPLDDVGIAAARHEANVLTVLLVRNRQTEATG